VFVNLLSLLRGMLGTEGWEIRKGTKRAVYFVSFMFCKLSTVSLSVDQTEAIVDSGCDMHNTNRNAF
jgi:hypothetical protein